MLSIVAAVAAAAAVAIHHDGPASSLRDAPSPSAGIPAPLHPTLHTMAVPASRPGHLPALTARPTQHFSLIGATWTDPHDRLAVVLQVRTRSVSTGTWRPWTPLTAGDDLDDEVDGGSASVRGGTAPQWVGDSNGIQLRVAGRVTATLPAGLRLDLIDPGRATAPAAHAMTPAAYVLSDDPGTPSTAPTATDTASTTSATTTTPTTTTPTTTPTTDTPASPTTSLPSTTTAPTPTPTRTATPMPTAPTSAPAPVAAVPAPTIVSRAGWQADETLRRAAPQYATTDRVVFVHHTDTTNAYTCSESPAIIRSLYAYHVLSQGWNDIGYNFLVDKCGTLFEGRYGGTDRPVIGAHTYGFNTDSTGVAVIGTYTATPAPEPVLATLARLAAWKLTGAGVPPSGTSALVEGASDSHGFTAGRSYILNAVSGHRDGYATECPGDALYRQLATVRALATQDVADGEPLPPTVTGATTVGGLYYTRTGRVTITWTDALSSAPLSGYTVLVDDQPALTTGPDVRTAVVPLTAGSHTLSVRAVPLPTTPTVDTPTDTPTVPPSGTTGTTTPAPVTASTTQPLTVISDNLAPAFTAGPTLGLRTGTVNRTGTPVSVTWRATDNTLLAKVTATSPAKATFTPTTTTWNTTAGPGTRAYTLTATDAAGNSRTATVSGTTTQLSEAAATRSGRWVTVKNTSYLDGIALASTTSTATLTWTFTGRAVAWTALRTAYSGQVRILLDGRTVATVDLKSAATAYRQTVWTRNGLTRARHTLTIVVLGTPHRPTVATDGITYLP